MQAHAEHGNTDTAVWLLAPTANDCTAMLPYTSFTSIFMREHTTMVLNGGRTYPE